MSDKETKNYNIEVILRYKSGEIFRDFELLSDQKNYNIQDRILNKYIYDYFNSYFDNEDAKKKLIKEFDGNIIMKYDNNYLDIKIIEQILNANTRNSEEKNEDHIKNNDPIFENMVVIKKDTNVENFKKDFINLICEIILENIEYESNYENTYKPDTLIYNIEVDKINIIFKYILRVLGSFINDYKDSETSKISLKEVRLDETVNVYIASGDKDKTIEKLKAILSNIHISSNKLDKVIINNMLNIFSIPDDKLIKLLKNEQKYKDIKFKVVDFDNNTSDLIIPLTFVADKQGIFLKTNLPVPDIPSAFKDAFSEDTFQRNVKKMKYFFIHKFILNTRHLFEDNDLEIKNFLLTDNKDGNKFNNSLYTEIKYYFLYIFWKCKDFYLNFNIVIYFMNIIQKDIDNNNSDKSKVFLFQGLKKIHSHIMNNNNNCYSYQIHLLLLFMCELNIIKNIDLNKRLVHSNEIIAAIFDSENEEIINFSVIYTSASGNEFKILNNMNLINLIDLIFIFYNKTSKFIMNFQHGMFKDKSLKLLFVDLMKIFNLSYSEKINSFILKKKLKSIDKDNLINKDKKILQETFNGINKEESIFNLFLNKSKSTESNKENYISKLFSILEDDFNKYKEYESQQKFKNNNYIEKIDSENLPKGYITSEKTKEILLKFGKYFDYFNENENIEEQFSLLERNKEETKKIITYYNIFHILEKLYLPPGTIIYDNFYDEISRQEIKQYFVISKLIPTIQKNELQFIREENNSIKVYFQIDYEIKKFTSYIEFNINFYNISEKPEIKEIEMINQSNFVFKNINFKKKNNLEIKFKFLEKGKEVKENINTNSKIKTQIIDFIKEKLTSVDINKDNISKTIKDITFSINEDKFFKYNFEGLKDIIKLKFYIDDEYINYLKNNNYDIIENIFLDNKKGESSFEKYKTIKTNITDNDILICIAEIQNEYNVRNNDIFNKVTEMKTHTEANAEAKEKEVENKKKFYKKIINKKNILSKDTLVDLNINLKLLEEEHIKTNKSITINNNYYKISYEKNNELREDKYLKQLYEIYDAKIFNKNIPSQKVYFNPRIDYEKVRYDFNSLKTKNEIFLLNRKFINNVEDTFLIEKICDYYDLNYIDNNVNTSNTSMINDKIEKLFIDYFFFKENTDLFVNNSYYNIRNVELIEPSKFNNENENNKEKFKIKPSNDFRLKHKELSSIYQVYLYIKYYKKNTKDEKIPKDVIISETANCMTKAAILDNQLLDILGAKNYKENFFSNELLKILNKKNTNVLDNTIEKLKKIDEPKYLEYDEEKKIKELNKLGKKNEELNTDEIENVNKLKQLGGIKEKINKKLIKYAIKKKYNKKPNITEKIRKKHLKTSTAKLINYYLKL